MAVPTVRKHNFMTPKQRKKALQSLEWYLAGFSWTEIKAKGGYSWSDFAWKMAEFPDLGKAYQEARRSSAHSFEDKALDLAKELVSPNEFTGTQVRAHEVAMNQYRWSASRRNPAEYAEAGASKVSLVVPIQINSSLNLAEPGAVEQAAEPDPYQFAAEVVAAEAIEAPPEAEDDPEVVSEPDTPQTPPEDALEALAGRLGLPDELPAAIKRRVSKGRPRKKHKSAQRTSITRTTVLKSARKNPVVARALGLDKEPDDGGSNSGG